MQHVKYNILRYTLLKLIYYFIILLTLQILLEYAIVKDILFLERRMLVGI